MTTMNAARRAVAKAGLLIGLGMLAGLGAQPASAQSGVEIGVLNCSLTASKNYVIRSKQEFDCEFRPASGDVETYKGKMTRTGVDLTIKEEFLISWGVLAPTDVAKEPGSLRGTYVGGSAEVALAAGIGANVLVGGGGNSFTLQPLSVSGVLGAGASLTVSNFELE